MKIASSIAQTPSPASPASESRRRLAGDVLAAYFAAGVKIGAWALVSAVVYRVAGVADFAMLALIRGTIGILNYTSVGLAPALTRMLAQALAARVNPSGELAPPDEKSLYSSGMVSATISVAIGLALVALYALFFSRLQVVPPGLSASAPWAVVLIGAGTLFRIYSDPSAAVLQIRGKIALDNLLVACGDLLWAILTLVFFRSASLLTASATFALANVVALALRAAAVWRLEHSPWPPRLRFFDRSAAVAMLSFGGLLLVSQLTEYFYAPTDYILIDRFFSDKEIAAYAPGVQIDLGLLMLVGGVASVLLPRAALAHAAGQTAAVRRYYIRGTLASTALLALAAMAVWLMSPFIFRLWFGAHPPPTSQILDLVLIGTVVGGSSGVGRSVLIGMGRVRAFTFAALLAGITNVIASYIFVRHAHLGLRGILYGTVLAVVWRCGLWMPWFVLRTLRREQIISAAREADGLRG